jgi:hypothetical protein
MGQHYPCYQLSTDNKIYQGYDIEASTDADALLLAQRDIKTSAELPSIEIWQGTRMVGRLTFQSSAR